MLMDDERLCEPITMTTWHPGSTIFYSLPVLVLRCGGRLPDTAALAEMRARSRVLDAPDA